MRNFEGVRIELADTAGLERDVASGTNSSPSIMETAQRNQTDVVEKAQLVLLCVAPDADNWTWAAEQIDRLYETGKEFLVVLTKSDLARDDLDAEKYLQAKVTQKTGSQRKLISVSSHSGENLDRLKFEISATAIGTATGENAIVGSTLLRTRESLKLASSSVAGALEAAQRRIWPRDCRRRDPAIVGRFGTDRGDRL